MTTIDIKSLTPPGSAQRYDIAPPTGSTFSTSYVIEFARLRLDQVDGYLGWQLDVMKGAARAEDAIGGVLEKLANYTEDFDSAEKLADIKGALTEAASKLPEGSELQTKLLAMRDHPNALLNIDGDTTVIASEVASLQKELEGLQKTVGRSTQEGQLMVNQKMGERNEILQLCASLLQSMNETAKGILGRS